MNRVPLLAAAAILSVTVAAIIGVLNGGDQAAGALVTLGCLIGFGMLIVRDTVARGRGAGRWLLACIFLAPVAVPLWLIVAVYDRIGGRLGIEARWEPAVRWCLLAGLVLAALSGFLALRSISVPTTGLPSALVTVPATANPHPPNIATSFDNSGTEHCGGSALQITLGKDFVTTALSVGVVAETPESLELVHRCTEKAGRSMVASEVGLAGAFAACLLGVGIGRRHGPQSDPRGDRARVAA